MATFESVIPRILIQTFESGDGCSGVAYTGLDTGVRDPGSTSPLRGLIYKDTKSGAEPGAIDGGLFSLGALCGDSFFPKLSTAWVKMPGATAIALSAVDPDGVEFDIASVTANTMVQSALDGWYLLPGWQIKVAATGALTGDGVIYLVLDEWQRPLRNTSFISHM